MTEDLSSALVYLDAMDERISPPVEMTKMGPDASGVAEILRVLA
jgi:hypothetical protein